MNILYGLLKPDKGAIYIRGQEVQMDSPREAIAQKIGLVSQHFSLVPTLTVSDNIVLGGIPTNRFGILDKKLAKERVLALAESCGLRLDAQSKIEDISAGEQQRVEILKALYLGVEILILDEPTALLTSQETEHLFKVLRSMTTQGKSVIFITHKLRDAMLCDRITVLRAGQVVLVKDISSTTEDEITGTAFGRRASTQKPVHEPSITTKRDSVVLELKDASALNDRGLTAFKGISFSISVGEIMGIAGVAGNGQSELVEVITGLRKCTAGSISLKGRKITNCPPGFIREAGLGHIPEERQRRGRFSDLSLAENAILGRENKPPFIYTFIHTLLTKLLQTLHYSVIRSFCASLVSDYAVKTSGIEEPIKHLSGGNLQKLVLAREFAWEPDLIVAAQPTRGLDVRTTEFVHERLLEQKEKGKTILLVSYSLDEILGLSDKIGVMFEGEMTVVSPKEVDSLQIEKMMLGASR